MPLPTFDKKEDIPAAFASEYVERNGKWVPNVEDVDGLKASQRRALDEKKQLEERLEKLLGGKKPEEVAELLKKAREEEEKRERESGNFEKLLEKRINETKAEYEKRINELSPYKQKYEDRELEYAIRDAATKAGVLAADLDLVIPIVKGRRVKLDEKTGKPVVLDKDGDPTSLTVDKFFAETFKGEAPKFYGASGGSGGGSTGGSGTGSRGTGKDGAIAVTDTAALLANVDRVAKGELKVLAQ